MQNLVKKYVDKFVHEKTARRKVACVTLVLALVVTAGVYWQFKLTGAALANDYNCGLEEHTHTDECYEEVLICGLDDAEGHVHTDACYEKQLVCGLSGHTHTAECLSDSTADVETASDWENTVPSLAGAWSELVVAAAQSQIGYQESTLNYILADDGETRNGYTRYGEWAGNPYGDWDAMFVSFCLHYAGVSTEDFPEAAGAYAWSVNLQEMDLYAEAAEYTPSAGDLVFFDTDEDGKIDRVGIAAEMIAADAENAADKMEAIAVIEGNYEDAVCLNEYAADDAGILGYGMLPEGETAVPVVERETTLTYEGSDYSVDVTYNWEAGLPVDTELSVSEYAADSEAYLSRYAEAADLYGWQEDFAPEFRLFNITLIADAEEVEPSGDVEVTISCFEAENAEYTDYTVTHYGEDETESVDFETECEDGVQTFCFSADGFSDYGISAASEEGNGTETATYTITRGDTVVIPGSCSETSVEGLTILPAYQVCTEIKTGGSYLIANYQSTTAVFLTDTATTSGSTSALALVSDSSAELLTQDNETYLVSDAADDADLWTFTGADGSYTIAGGNGYINISYYDVTLVKGNPQTLSVPLVDGALYYTIGYNGYYLDRYSTTAAAGWYDGANNANERWYLLQENGTSVTGTTPGTYTVTTESGTYTIVVEDYATVEGVSPSGTLIHLFDYWLTDQEAADNYATSDEELESGINKSHALKFSKGYPNGSYNQWTGSVNVYQNIVQNKLSDGYPLLNSLTYTTDDFSVPGSTESLAYLFDPAVAHEGKASYAKVQNLLQIDGDGYYYYDSTKNYAEYDEDTNSFILYDDWAVNQGSTMQGQFFPFNSYSEVSQDTYDTDEVLNHYFGMSLTSRFIQQYEGHTSSSKVTPTTFEFSGDDDVWVFIDNVLVADLGGIHDAASVSIDFSTGKIVINEGTGYERSTTLYDMFSAAEQEGTVSWNTDNTTFADNTYHTLKFYYLERGNSASNMRLKYNLTEIPETGIYKVNQYGDAIEGAEFTVYRAYRDSSGDYYYLYDNKETTELAASVTEKLDAGTYTLDENNNICDSSGSILISSRYIGTTDANGEMIFLDEYDMTYTLKELEEMFGSCFIMKETEVPAGYRIVAEDVYLRIVSSQVLVCDNTYDSGVYASPNLLVTATDTIYDETGKEIEYYDVADSTVDGTLFAVVLKYIGDGDASTDTDTSHWAPVYGSDETGYTVMDMSSYTSFYTAAIYAAQMMKENGYSDSVFSLSGSGSMQLSLTALPGDISTYYYLAENKSDTKYTIGYYYTTASSLDGATSENTVRVNADSGTITTVSGQKVSYSGFSRTFGATINVPNLSNVVLVQKLDQYGNLVNGARFAMYAVEEDTTAGIIYYIADDGTKIVLDSDDDGDNKGTARLVNGSTNGEYTISAAEDATEGVITVIIGDATYTISPVEIETTMEEGSQTSSVTGRFYNTAEDGTAVFDYLTGSTYYIREIAAPEGYLLNTTEIMVLVTYDTVYANAGTADDGVTVARAPGYVVSTLAQVAAEGDIDNTLSWIYTTLQVNTDQSNTFAFSSYADDSSKWSELKNAVGTTSHTFLTYDEAYANTLFNYVVNTNREEEKGYTGTRRLYTDEGWSYLEIYQDSGYYEQLAAAAKASGDDITYAYTELTEAITSLFSRSVYIQVTDPEPEITFVKIDGTTVTGASGEAISASSADDTISGVTFAIYKITETTDSSGNTVYEKGGAVMVEDEAAGDGSTIAYTSVSDENGVVKFSGVLETGTYWIEEVSAAAGYNAATWHWIVTIDESGNATYTAVANEDSIASAEIYYSEVTNQTAPDEDTDGNLLYTYTVDGVKYPYSYYTAEEKVDGDNNIYTEYTYYTAYWPNYYYEMPSTGGPGTRMLTLIGIALCGGAVLCGGAGWLFGRRRRRV